MSRKAKRDAAPPSRLVLCRLQVSGMDCLHDTPPDCLSLDFALA